MKLEDLCAPLARACGERDAPVAVFAALWPLARALRTPVGEFLGDLHGMLLDAVGARTLLMPAFAGGFVDGHCDLDATPSTTGAWSEHFRTRPGVARTLCPYFSFAYRSPAQAADARELSSLRPADAWGVGSLYEWLQERDAEIVTVGVHPTHCSFSHRAEWLERDRIDYRHDKAFEGEVTWRGARFAHRLNLYVRDLARNPINDFTGYLPAYREHGMTVVDVEGVQLSGVSARAKMAVLTGALARDPHALIAPPAAAQQA